ncbi:HTH domain-containing protein [Acinetobacter cumulans]|uniref:HTH domain-containing protein n=1 Tax=Acinetobacter cumulans TaxID=2136182 RepID=A0A498CUM6_9GAMM|nr:MULTISPECIES: Crp/Fnr family transcriptional regulator [Acinetobacter]RFS29244.1 Crp/Fnr family transcriptional regulator [Acinetobacter sp. SWAC5]RKG40171.1 HTH domain-containing protein [Acinetobacter cumulans]RLL33156.1 HTH domain-containing protein [Acinetobacter cumulans]RZG56655.1 Crp/Fnr family transcriptional regulator [Acinetobacter sp. WCHAc060006]
MLDQQYQTQLSNNYWYAQLSPEHQQYIATHSQLLEFNKDQNIFLSGDAFNGMYAVLNGAIRLGYIDIQGKEAVAAIAEPIMWFGEISLVDQLPRSHDAIALQKTTVLHWPSRSIQHLLNEQPQFWFHIAQLTSQKLRFAFLELISIQTQNIRQRLAQRLLFILNGYGNHITIEQRSIHLSQEQLAQLLICSRQTINQALQELEKLGVLKVAFRKIEILDLALLHRIAHTLTIHEPE